MSEPISTLVNAPVVRTVPVDEFDWDANAMEMQYIVCPRHPGMKYLTKDPRCRNLHIISIPDHATGECDCYVSRMVVLLDY